jgi:hypothetical protein
MTTIRSHLIRSGMALAIVVALGVTLFPSSGASAASSGYWLLGGDGGVFTFGTDFSGSAGTDLSRCPANTSDRNEPNGTCWSMAATPDGGGYWILNGDTGTIYPFGNAIFFGDPAATLGGVPREFVPNGVAIVATGPGDGYWVLESGLSGLGSVLPFGGAIFYGDTQQQAVPHAGVPVGMAATPDGRGYWIVDSDGGVFSFGDAGFFRSMGGKPLNQPIVGMASTTDGRGYYLAGADGGVFTFGDAVFAGSMGGRALQKPVVGIAVDHGSGGYWLAAADGGVFSFGGAPFRGSLGGSHLNRPIFAITSTVN